MAKKKSDEPADRTIPVVGQHRLPPDPALFKALAALGYTLPEAIADLVDNSIDAKAKNVLVRIVRDRQRPLAVLVIDDGHGITDDRIDECMRVGGSRDYDDEALGMFGMGLKTASFSQAASLAVFSKAPNSEPTGRMWVPERARHDWSCDVVDPVFAGELLMTDWEQLSTRRNGTVVRWDDVFDFKRPMANVDRYISSILVAIGKHLGLLFHRFLSRSQVTIHLDVQNVDSSTIKIPVQVASLDPFAYPAPGNAAYPKLYTVDGGAELGKVPLKAHIWPPRLRVPGYRLGGGSVASKQGFYFYRRDRLIQAGSWNDLRDSEPHLSLARVEIDLAAPFDRLFQLTVKKSGVEVPQSFADALATATAPDGSTWPRYIDAAQRVYRRSEEANKTVRIGPGSGMPVKVRNKIKKELGISPSAGKIDFKWKKLQAGELFRVDNDESVIYLNSTYRQAVNGASETSANDAPLLKSALFILLEHHIGSERMGARLKQDMSAWQAILIEAAKAKM
jgi:hypothetical protein